MFITNFAKFEDHRRIPFGPPLRTPTLPPNNSGSAEPVRGPVVIRSPGLFVIGGSRRSPNVGIETVGDSRWPATHFYIDDRITIAGWELTEQFVLAGGPGGQIRQQVSTAVQLFFDIAGSPSLPRAGQGKCPEDSVVGRVSKDGVLCSSRAVSAARRRNRA